MVHAAAILLAIELRHVEANLRLQPGGHDAAVTPRIAMGVLEAAEHRDLAVRQLQ
jgi:hypothetical protein